LDIVTASHYKLMRDVPIVGWDVTFTPHGIYLLEVPSSLPTSRALLIFLPCYECTFFGCRLCLNPFSFLVRATYFQVNLSCNFFRGSFDICEYVAFVDAYWTHLEKLERAVQANGK